MLQLTKSKLETLTEYSRYSASNQNINWLLNTQLINQNYLNQLKPLQVLSVTSSTQLNGGPSWTRTRDLTLIRGAL